MRARLPIAWFVCAFATMAGGWSPAVTSPAARADEVRADPLDWPHWRGPEQNGISRETGLIDDWDPSAEGTSGNVLWRNEELAGISTPIVLRGKLYTIVRDRPGTPAEGEKVICVDAATGKKLWENRFNVFLSDVPPERVGWSSCVGDPTTGQIYALGVCGYFQCLDGETGKTLWSRSLNELFGILTTYGGRTNFPVVFDDLVIISGVMTGWGEMARPAHRLLAFDKKSGELQWINGTRVAPEDTTYSTPFLTVLNGQAAMVFGSSDGAVHAWQPRTGKPIWSFQVSRRGLNVSPIVVDGRVYMGNAEENLDNTTMGAILAIDGGGSGDITKSGELWRAQGMVGKSSPVMVDGRVYACDDGGKLYVLDAASGKSLGKPLKMRGTIVRGSPVYADGKIYACTTSAWHVFEPTRSGAKLVKAMRMSEEDIITGSPIVSHGRIYLPTEARMYCLGAPRATPSATPRPPAPQEAAPGSEDTAAQVQVVPAEVLLKPGEHQEFVVRLFNARGQFLRNSPASFTLTGPGEISKDGKYLAASAAAHTATILKAKVGDLEAQARIRVVPELPWRFDFSDGEVPITWIGARHRHVTRDVDGNKLLAKLTTIPKGQRSQSWMGHPQMHDYTVQADVMGRLANSAGQTTAMPPDVGLIAQRYTMDLMGEYQAIQIRSWTSHRDRFSKTVPFKWEPNTWYTMKFSASAEDGQAVLRGKVWKRGTEEPSAWTIEAVDPAPNLIGSPGLFGNANVSELYIDNVTVTSNTP